MTNPSAGHFTPFVIDLTREDGEQDLRGFELTSRRRAGQARGRPPLPRCRSRRGRLPRRLEDRPRGAASGPGPTPLWVPQPGKGPTAVYLAGPYKGAPYSIVAIVPAQAGPFDLGTVVSPLGDLRRPRIRHRHGRHRPPAPDPRRGPDRPTAAARGDRPPRLTLNPTGCSEMRGHRRPHLHPGGVAHPRARFQVDGCTVLAFKPNLSLKLKGGTKRGASRP